MLENWHILHITQDALAKNRVVSDPLLAEFEIPVVPHSEYTFMT